MFVMLKKYLLIILSLIGLIDAIYLTYEHYSNFIPPCGTSIFVDCGKVLQSSYSVVLGLPLALLGLFHYAMMIVLIVLVFAFKNKIARYLFVFEAAFGFIASLYLVFLQLIVIRSICLYCMASAITSTALFILMHFVFARERKKIVLFFLHFGYIHFLKPVFFLIDPEKVHVSMVHVGKTIGSYSLTKKMIASLLLQKEPMLEQKLAGIRFPYPLGLAAGFDYEADLSETLSPLGFGFQTIGTITKDPYEGNPRPMLGRLPKSKSLMVNKGFKNLGADATIKKLKKRHFEIPVGVSIGRTNSLKLETQEDSVKDIIHTFKKFESSKLKIAYYELNISCPNLLGNISFYPPKNLDALLTAVDKLRFKKPVFIKMPIEKTDSEVTAMLKVIDRHKVTGVIFGNLQKDRNHKSLDKKEVAKFNAGNFSGKPTFERSNELIALTYRTYKKRFIIIGCGGIFSAKDAYKKIILGANVVQLITGMIFEGPALIMEINFGLVDLLQNDGLTHISQAVGSKNTIKG